MSFDLLVATDGRPGALGALRMARLLAERDHARVEVVTVFESADLYAAGSPHAIASLPPHYVPAALEALRSRVRTQLADVGPGAADWPLTVELGSVAPTIARAAAKGWAGMILVGMREPGKLERWLARETLLRLIHLAHVPVLAVPHSADELPRRGVVAVDFSDLSLRAARHASETIVPGGQVHLAHVSLNPAPNEPAGWAEWERTYRVGVERRLEEFAEELDPSGRLTVKTHVLSGEPDLEILRLAGEVRADLIAAGSQGLGRFGRLILGSVSGGLAHGARCSLLVAPPPTVPAELGLTERDVWSSLGTAGAMVPSEPPESGSGTA